MKYLGFVQYGNLLEYRKYIKRIGTPVTYEKGTDVIPILRKSHQAFYLDTGLLYLRLFKPDGLYIQLAAFQAGTIMPLFDFPEVEDLYYGDAQMLVAVRGAITGYCFPMKEYHRLKAEDDRFRYLMALQHAQVTSYLCIEQMLYRDGPCIMRISNLLFHCWLYKDYEEDIFPTSQEELACIVNESKSQVKRAISRLAEEGGIVQEYGQLRIVDAEILKKYISDSMLAEEIGIGDWKRAHMDSCYKNGK